MRRRLTAPGGGLGPVSKRNDFEHNSLSLGFFDLTQAGQIDPPTLTTTNPPDPQLPPRLISHEGGKSELSFFLRMCSARNDLAKAFCWEKTTHPSSNDKTLHAVCCHFSACTCNVNLWVGGRECLFFDFVFCFCFLSFARPVQLPAPECLRRLCAMENWQPRCRTPEAWMDAWTVGTRGQRQEIWARTQSGAGWRQSPKCRLLGGSGRRDERTNGRGRNGRTHSKDGVWYRQTGKQRKWEFPLRSSLFFLIYFPGHFKKRETVGGCWRRCPFQDTVGKTI